MKRFISSLVVCLITSTLSGVVISAQPANTATLTSIPVTKKSPPHTKAQTVRPNIVVMLADDWGFSDVGAFGSEIATPNLDALAAKGVKFSNFHVASSCSPTRSMLLTGVDNHRNGVGNMRETIPRAHVNKPGYLSVLNQNVVTVASLLKDSGYRTYVAGKWHVGKEPHNLPPARGFDRSIVQGDSGSDNWLTAQRYLDLTDKVYWFEDGKPAVMPEEYYSSAFFVDKSIEYLKQDASQKKPFFTYLAFQANHIPVQAPKSFIDVYKGKYDQGWHVLRQARRDKAIELGLIPKDTPMVNMSSTQDWNRLSAQEKAYQARSMEVYAAMAQAMDYHIGRFIQYLKDTGEYDNTVFVFLSDNGAEASDPYAVLSAKLWLKWQYKLGIDDIGLKGGYGVIGPSWASAAAAPLSTYKFYAGEGGIRVPLIVSGPKSAGFKAGAIQANFAHINDVAPTLLELAQVAKPLGTYQGQQVEPMTGRSLLPVLKGNAERTHPINEPVGYELSGNKAIFKGDLKLVLNIPPIGDGQWHLYDIRQDPGETHDLKLSQPETYQAMLQDYDAYAKANDVLQMPEGYDPITQVQINALMNVYIPRLKWYILGIVLLSCFAVYGYRKKRQQGIEH